MSTEITMPNDTDVVLSRTFDAPRELLFEVWTSPEHLPHWLLGPEGWTMTACEIDLRPGGRARVAWRHDNGDTMEVTQDYREVEPPARLVSTESWGGDWAAMEVTVTFEAVGGRTALTQTIRFASAEARERALGVGMTQGLTINHDRLELLLAGLPA
ncbi:MAG TPA: SRPBCC domain-containing protein [Mycobacteriales bacterium]|jgi:uncharacterized protein YndB with AHSA1/START domain|nr:SRPBCC domain-containing protein [Mycobacteriales bacterium]